MALNQSARFRWALLYELSEQSDPGEWCALYDILFAARMIAVSKFHMREDISDGTLKAVRKQLQHRDLIETRPDPNRGRKWQIRLTDAGRAEASLAPTSQYSSARIDLPDPPYRVGKGHLLNSKAFTEFRRAVQEGKLDFVVIPHKAKTKTGYWDEGDEDDDI